MGIGGSLVWLSTKPSLDPIVTDWVTRTEAAAGTVSAATAAAINKYVKDSKTENIWSKLSNGLILPFASDSFAGCFVALVAPASYSPTLFNFSSGDYSLSGGLTLLSDFNRSVSTNIIPSDLFTTTSARFSAYLTALVNVQSSLFYSNSAEGRLNCHMPWSDGNIYWDCFNDSNGRVSAARGTAQGVFTGSRTSTGSFIAANGSVIASSTNSGGNLPTQPITLFNGAAGRHQSTVRHFEFGAGLTSSEEATHNALLQTLQTDLGRQV